MGVVWAIWFFLFCGLGGIGIWISVVCCDRFDKKKSAIISFEKFVLFYELNPKAYELRDGGPVRLNEYKGKEIYIYFNILDMTKYKIFKKKQEFIKINKKTTQQTLLLTKMVREDIEDIEYKGKFYIQEAKDYVEKMK